MRLARINYQKAVNFEVFESYFRTFCKNKGAENEYSLRADAASFKEGLQYWYGGRENGPLADLLFNYLSKGMKNHLLTFSEFIGFCRDFMLSTANHQAVIFQIISDGNPDGLLKILTLLRVFVTSPKGSPFANELMSILSFYVDKSLRVEAGNTKEVVYD